MSQTILDYMPTYKTRVCTRCHQRKPLTAFWKTPKEAGGREHQCAQCRQERKRITRARKRTQGPRGSGRAPTRDHLGRHQFTAAGPMRCPTCHRPLVCQIVNERTVEWCGHCRLERPVPIRGMENRFKEFVTTQNTIAEDVASAQRPVNKKLSHPRSAKQLRGAQGFKVLSRAERDRIEAA